MGLVPRHIFLEQALANRAYDDTALPLGFGQTISQPYVVARMIEILIAGRELGKTLEIGAGCGYQAAILGVLSKQVFAVERIAPLLARARDNLKQLRLSHIGSSTPMAISVCPRLRRLIPSYWLPQRPMCLRPCWAIGAGWSAGDAARQCGAGDQPDRTHGKRVCRIEIRCGAFRAACCRELNEYFTTLLMVLLPVFAGCASHAPAPVEDRGAAPGAAKSAAAPGAAAVDARSGFYTVKKGDTLYSIAWTTARTTRMWRPGTTSRIRT
jgi:hypothetical protein